MQCFRLMGLPDKVIAFDELPERLVQPFELITADGFPRHWKHWLGKKKRIIRVPNEKDPWTGQVRSFQPIIEEDHYFYLVDSMRQPSMDAWVEIQNYVKSHVDKDVRLKDNLADMAVPLAPNKTDGVMLEPEDVPVIPLPKEKNIEEGNENPPMDQSSAQFKCDFKDCGKEFKNDFGLTVHMRRMHQREKVSA